MDHTRRPAAPPPILDMTPEGEFRGPAPRQATWLDRALARVGGVALLMTMLAGGFLLVALAVVFIGLLLPVAVVAGLIAFGSLWWRVRRMRGQGAPGGAPGVARFVVIRR